MLKEQTISKVNFLLMFSLLLFLTFSKKEAGQKLSPLQILGFESWQQPTEEQIREQYKKLTDLYKENNNQDAKNEYKKIVSAFQQIKGKKFKMVEQNSGPQNAFRQNNRMHGEKPRSSGFYSHSHTYRPTYEFEERKLKLDVQDLLKDLHFDFLQVNPDQESEFYKHFQSEELKLNISGKEFFIWLLNNPVVIIAAVLISFGLFNLCTCCCCCCCFKCCRKNKGSNIKIKQVGIKRNGIDQFGRKNKRKENYKKMDQVDEQQGYHSN